MRLVKYGILILFLTIGLFHSCSNSDILYEIFNSDEERWLCELTAPKYKGRKTGTIECSIVKDYLVSELRSIGYSPKIQSFIFEDSIEMNNVIVTIPGDSDSIVVIGAHYDGAIFSSLYQAADDNASGVVALLSMAKYIGHTKYTTCLCFWDGEEYTGNSAFNGSRYFLQTCDDLDKILWYCNIDCCGRVNDDIFLFYSPDFYRQCVDAYSNVETRKNWQVNVCDKVQYSAGSDYVSFRDFGIPYWGWNDVSTLMFNHSLDDSRDNISIYKIQYVSSLTLRMLSHL